MLSAVFDVSMIGCNSLGLLLGDLFTLDCMYIPVDINDFPSLFLCKNNQTLHVFFIGSVASQYFCEVAS